MLCAVRSLPKDQAPLSRCSEKGMASVVSLISRFSSGYEDAATGEDRSVAKNLLSW